MLIRSVESFLTRHDISPSQFGRDVAHDPRLVSDLRAGRAPRPPLDQRVRGFMDGFELGLNRAAARQNPHSENRHVR